MKSIVKHIDRVLAVLGAAALLCTGPGCSKAEGRAAVDFTVTTEDAPATRTSWLNPATGQEDLDGSMNRLMLHWKTGDMVRIAGQGAARGGEHWQDYSVTGVIAAASGSRAVVSPAEGGQLLWDQSASGEQTFFAVYPSPASAAVAAALTPEQRAALSLSINGQMTGFIPSAQAPALRPGTGTGDGAAYVPAVYDPDMTFAYMGALGSAQVGQIVPLPFRPLFTAFEFQISSGEFESVRLSRFVLRNGADMAGAFAADLSQATPTVSLAGGAMDRFVEINFSSYPGGALTVTKGRPVTFAVLALGCDHSNVTIDFEGDRIGRRSLTLRSVQAGVQTPITFAGGRKYRIHGLSFPVQLNLISGEGITWTGDVNTGESLWWHDDDNINTGQDITWR